MKAFIIIYDDEGNASRGLEIDNISVNRAEIPNFGEEYAPSNNIEANFSATNHSGEANLRENTLIREQDPITGKWLETKVAFKRRERKFWNSVVHKRSIRR